MKRPSMIALVFLSTITPAGCEKAIEHSPDGKEAWVSNEGGNTISVVELETYTAVATIETEKMPHNVRYSKDGDIANVTLQGGTGLVVIDTETLEVAAEYPTGAFPFWAAVKGNN